VFTTVQDVASGRDFHPALPGHPDPYPIYQWLRSNQPVFWSQRMAGWVLSPYADAVEFLHDERFGRAGYIEGLERHYGPGPLFETYKRDLAFNDPPAHTRLRGLVSKAFTPSAVERLRPNIQRITDRLLDKVQRDGRMDVVASVAYPLPVEVISEMLGIPESDRDDYRIWMRDIARARGLVHTPEVLKRADAATRKFESRLARLAEDRRSSPRADLISALVAVEEHGDKLSFAELLSTVASLFGAGHETTKNLIGNGVLALTRNPAELERLHKSPDLIQSAVEEILRYDSPTQAPPARLAQEDVTIGGKTIRKGEAVSVLIGACNRDPEEFADPDRLDITRQPNHHIAFSLGIHFCLGAGLARAEGQIALGTIVERMPRLSLATDRLEWQVADRFRGLTALPVEF
jgi:pimeloyl-[acyl-carrier protein] synthase